MRSGQKLIPTKAEWLKKELPPRSRIGVDPKLIAEAVWATLEYDLRNSSLELVELEVNLIDIVWDNHYLNNSEKDVFVLNDEYAG